MSSQEQLLLAEKMNLLLHRAVKSSLYDRALYERFEQSFPIKTIEELRQSIPGTGQPQDAKILEALRKPSTATAK